MIRKKKRVLAKNVTPKEKKKPGPKPKKKPVEKSYVDFPTYKVTLLRRCYFAFSNYIPIIRALPGSPTAIITTVRKAFKATNDNEFEKAANFLNESKTLLVEHLNEVIATGRDDLKRFLDGFQDYTDGKYDQE